MNKTFVLHNNLLQFLTDRGSTIMHCLYDDEFPIYIMKIFVGAENLKIPKKSFSIIHSESVSVLILYLIFRYLKVPPRLPNSIRHSQRCIYALGRLFGNGRKAAMLVGIGAALARRAPYCR